MISLGVIDLIFIIALVLLYSRRRTRNLFLIVLIIYILIVLERFAPGLFAAVGNAIRSIDAVNDRMPHLNINPIITFR